MECGKSEGFRVFHDHQRSVRHVDTDLNNRRGNQNIQLARSKGIHDPILFLAVQFSVNESRAVFGEHLLGEKLGERHGGFQLRLFLVLTAERDEIACGQRFSALGNECFLLFHSRTDDVNLTARIDVLADEGVESFSVGFRHEEGIDLLSAGWHFVDDGNVRIAIHDHRQRSRDRRCAHRQNMRIAPLLGKRGALRRAESVLFVDHGKTEIVKNHGILNQRVRADHKIKLTVRQCGDRLSFLRRGHASDQKTDAVSHIAEHHGKLSVMLSGENFRRCHDGGLLAVDEREIDRVRGADSLTRANVTDDQTVHQIAAFQIGSHGFKGPLLRTRQCVRERLHKIAIVKIRIRLRNAELFVLAVQHHRKRKHEKLVERKSADRRHRFLHDVRLMDHGKRVRNTAQSQSASQLTGQIFGNSVRFGAHGFQGFPYHGAHEFLRDPRRQRIDRNEIAQRHNAVCRLHDGIGHRNARALPLDLAEKAEGHALRCLLLDIRLIEKNQIAISRFVKSREFRDRHALADHHAFRCACNGQKKRADLAVLRTRRRFHVSSRLVCARESVDRIRGGEYADLMKGFRPFFANAVKTLDRRVLALIKKILSHNAPFFPSYGFLFESIISHLGEKREGF